MRSLLFLTTLLILPLYHLKAQEITAVVVDAHTRQPIPYATVQYAANKGVITNDEGRFTLQVQLKDEDSLVISSMGFETLGFPVKDLKDETVYLKSSNIELKDVFLTNKNLKGKEIIEKVKQNVEQNYNFDLTHKRFFFRESQVNNIKRFDLLVDKSTFPDLDQALMTGISQKVPRYSDSYKEVLGDIYGNYDNQKLQVVKAANLHNPQSTTGLTELTDKLERIFKDNIKSNSFLKIKSGIIGVKVDAEELTQEMEEEKEVAKTSVEKTPEQKEKEFAERQKNLASSTTLKIGKLMKSTFWNEDITLDVFEKPGRYKFEVEGYAQMDNFIVYVISFTPKWRGDFEGKIYVNTMDYGVHRLDYHNIKPIKSFKLFGISASEDVYRGKMIFSRAEEGQYDPKYLEFERGDSFGIDRPLTIIEKNKFVKGKRRQNELDLDIKINAGDVRKYQLVVYESSPIGEDVFKEFTSTNSFEYETFKVYNSEFWKGYNIIEPNAAIKAFTALDEDQIY
ncbi:DUF5686 and carboxypeptidase regulatory-like domain-containing protein [Antarcticibacterium sp. 1MA-6-2]|uniref:carboxypeptidase-like regulatory domain-containing protein n=1 Tax=Antarcticibacterium sp. 1MA-6-2 TaxID=2908210 RepID=UPI001F1EAAEE|nr:carboxypeptidase-like regulatory domain-containing protein [Antarcticibacterium sp. 1MA-6-2]UJH91022.1 DUF5686 and carboxypeptidase regulatory-like domain-containing protein [Antarcticibacterium sp. 1MA-6-2]